MRMQAVMMCSEKIEGFVRREKQEEVGVQGPGRRAGTGEEAEAGRD